MKRLLTLLLIAALSIIGMQAATEKIKQVDGGGSGPHKAIAVKDSEMPNFVIYRPQDMLLAHACQGALPALMWGNGACLDSSIDYERFLTGIASQGYIVMAIGEMQENRDDFINLRFTNHQIQWLEKFDDRKIFAINIRQEYNSSTYADDGYLFLLVDMTATEAPQIKVRTWQPNEVAGGTPAHCYSVEDLYQNYTQTHEPCVPIKWWISGVWGYEPRVRDVPRG